MAGEERFTSGRSGNGMSFSCRLIEGEREPIQDVPAIYFVMPTDENIQRICKVSKLFQ